jgi:hypothetical protein
MDGKIIAITNSDKKPILSEKLYRFRNTWKVKKFPFVQDALDPILV